MSNTTASDKFDGGISGEPPTSDPNAVAAPYQAPCIDRTGIFLAVLAIAMLFAGFVSGYIVRYGLSDDWRPVELPGILWVNSAVLLLGSVTMERSRRCVKTATGAACLGWLLVTAAFGAVFLAGQAFACNQLSAHGIHIATNPSSSFFYLLTGAHAAHLMGGLVALGIIVIRLRCNGRSFGARGVEITGIYWHSMTVLWFAVLLLLWFKG